MNRMGPKVATALVVGLALVAGACGSSAKKDDASGTGNAVTATVESTTSTSRSTATTAGSSSNDVSGLGSAGDCLQAAGAYATLAAAMLQGLGGTPSSDVSQLQGELNDLKSQIPSAIQDDFNTFAQGVQAYGQAMQGVDMSNLLDPATQSKLEAAGKALDTPEMKTAQDNIDAYFKAHCS